MGSVMPALASSLHPVVDTSAGTQWGQAERGLWSTQELRGDCCSSCPRRALQRSQRRGVIRGIPSRGRPAPFHGHSFQLLLLLPAVSLKMRSSLLNRVKYTASVLTAVLDLSLSLCCVFCVVLRAALPTGPRVLRLYMRSTHVRRQGGAAA